MNDYNELNKIKINLERELDRLSNAIEKIKNYIVDVEKGTGEYAFWNGNVAYSSIEKIEYSDMERIIKTDINTAYE